MLLWEVRWQFWVRHEVEENALHGGSLEVVVPKVNVALTALSRPVTHRDGILIKCPISYSVSVSNRFCVEQRAKQRKTWNSSGGPGDGGMGGVGGYC